MYSIGIEEEFFVFDATTRRAVRHLDRKFLKSAQEQIGSALKSLDTDFGKWAGAATNAIGQVGAGLLAGGPLGAGLAFGLAAKANEDDYAGLPLDTREQIDIAEKRFETADTQALIANIGLGFGAAVTLFGAVWLGLELAKDGDEGAARLTPEIAPGHVGLALSGSFVGEP